MKKEIYWFATGRYTVNDVWNISNTFVVNRIYYVNSGSATIRNGLKKYKLSAGHIYLFPQCNNLELISADMFDHTFFDFKSNYVFNPDTFMEIKTENSPLSDLYRFFNALIIHKERHKDTLKKLLETILEYIDNEYTIPLLKNNLICSAIDYICKNSATITTAELAKIFNINESHFIRTFKKHTGITPMKYIYSYRLSEGIRFLDTGKSISETARLCGYDSASAFCVAFKKVYGIPPSKLHT